MRDRPIRIELPQFLSGWKEIANYLGKGVRTVQRYELQLGLPVRRPAGKPWGSVVATKAELDAWVNASPIRDVFRLSRKDASNEYAAYMDNMKRNLARMMRLRNQMLALRSEVRQSVELLQSSIYELQGQLNSHHFGDISVSNLLADDRSNESSLVRDELDRVAAPVDYWKAS
ncbi:MAG TPA: hypothetical protein VMS18_19770 [Candidatus Binatia bacterium]|nr:hypothetical protein [Candidatus Binatia bacterium]